MRISTASQFDRSVDLIQRRQQSLQASHDQLVSGKRIVKASDDPTRAASAERALARDARLEVQERALETSQQFMLQAESALGSAVDLMQRVRELVVQSGNAAAGDASRPAIAAELKGLRQQLLDIANQQDSSGAFLFAGLGGSGEAFSDGGNGVTFSGRAGTMTAAGSEALPLSVDGKKVWMESRSGNGVFKTSYEAVAGTPATHQPHAWIDSGRVTDPSLVQSDKTYTLSFLGDAASGFQVQITRDPAGTPALDPNPRAYVPGQAIEFDGIAVTVSGVPAPGRDAFKVEASQPDLSVFDVLDRLTTELGAPGRTGAQVAQTVQDGLRDLDSTMGSLMTMRSNLGWRMEQADGLSSRWADGRLAAQSERSAAEDLDMVEAISGYQNKQTSYDAALKAYAMVQRLSLFEYIR
jgi:flagellar hook-associated protein 3 FlgL